MPKDNWPGILRHVTDKTKALALICLIVNAIFLASLPALGVGQRIYAFLLCGIMLIVIAVGIILIELSEKRAGIGASPFPNLASTSMGENRVPAGLDALMDSSNWPMFFTDLNRVVIRCNRHLGQLLDSSEQDFEGKSVRGLIERLAQQVPEPRRGAFLKRQRDLQDEYDAKLHPHSDEFEYLDTTRHPVSSGWRGKYKLWIHADRIKLDGKEVGYFVMYRTERIDQLPPQSTKAG
jgi:PAS domain-containing protein